MRCNKAQIQKHKSNSTENDGQTEIIQKQEVLLGL